MTHDPQMVDELRARMKRLQEEYGTPHPLTPVLIRYSDLKGIVAALEASHHAELVEALERAAAATRTLARNILDDVGPGSCDGWVGALNTISRNIEGDLAKIGGGQ